MKRREALEMADEEEVRRGGGGRRVEQKWV